MKQITLSEEQAIKIRSANEAIEFIDRDGIFVGTLVTSDNIRRSPLTLSELQGRRLEQGGKSLSEILTTLRERE